MRAFGLTYHDVVARGDRSTSGFEGPGPDRYKVDSADFEQHLDAIAAVTTPIRLPDEGVFLTFDDGGASASATARLLEQRGLHGHFFVVTGRIGSPGFLAAEDIRAIAAAGHVVGSHSQSHAILTRLAEPDVIDELRRSKTELEDLLGLEVEALSIPRGYVTRRILQVAAATGYRHVFTSEPWLSPRDVGGATAYGRFAVTEATTAKQAAQLAAGRRRIVWATAGGWYTRKLVKRATGRTYESLRRAALARR